MGHWIADMIAAIGYPGVALLTLIENVFPPIPSELVLPLAGYLVSRGQLTMAGAIAAGTSGSVLGALLFYWLGQRIGEQRLKALADRHGRWLTLSRDDIDRASDWFERRGNVAVFVCRMIPGLRSVMSIPAGIHRMPLPAFVVFTTLGSALWTGLLVWAGYVLGANFESVQEFIDPVATVVLMIVTVIYVWRGIRHKGTSTGS